MAGNDGAGAEVLAIARAALAVAHFDLGVADTTLAERGEEFHHRGPVVEGHGSVEAQVPAEESEVAVPIAQFRKPEGPRYHPMEAGAEKPPQHAVRAAPPVAVHQLDFRTQSIQQAGEFEGIELPIAIGVNDEREPGRGEEIPKGGSVAPVSCVPERPEFRNLGREHFQDLGGPVSASIVQDQNLEVTTGTPQGLARPVSHPTDGPGVVEGRETGTHPGFARNHWATGNIAVWAKIEQETPDRSGLFLSSMERLALHRFASPWLRNQHVARYRWAAGYAAGKRVLDLASGAGYGSGILNARDARWVVSADLSPEAFQEAELPASGAGALRGVLADASRLPFRDRSFDLYVSFETIEHVGNDHAVVREARRILAPGGVFICSTPEREVISPGRTLEDRPDNPFHVREYSRSEFEALLRTGFDHLEWYGQTPASEGHKRRLEALAGMAPLAARKLHQVRNILRLPGEGEARHAPYPLRGASGWPEVLIAVCGPIG